MSRRRFSLQPPAPPAPSPDAFVQMPLACLPPQSDAEAERMRALYQWAYEQAAKAAQPSIVERDLLGTWN